MNRILDRLILLGCGVALSLQYQISELTIWAAIAAVTVNALNGFYEKKAFCYVTVSIFVALCLYRREFIGYLPLIFYDVYPLCHPLFYPAGLLPLIYGMKNSPHLSLLLQLVLLLGISFLLRHRAISLETLKEESKKIRDTSRELSLLLERRNKDLMEKQEYEIQLATLNERNRIAREIHDNVGHMLSRSILQVGALIAINQDEKIADNLYVIKDTLSQAMDSIRTSVHDLYDESIDLYTQVYSLIREFQFCPVTLDYDIEGEMENALKYCFIAIIKEAMSNTARHSNATQMEIILREHPVLYQLIIRDNGTADAGTRQDGLGLKNMRDRVSAFEGICNMTQTHGFQIFISIPKGGTRNEGSGDR